MCKLCCCGSWGSTQTPAGCLSRSVNFAVRSSYTSLFQTPAFMLCVDIRLAFLLLFPTANMVYACLHPVVFAHTFAACKDWLTGPCGGAQAEFVQERQAEFHMSMYPHCMWDQTCLSAPAHKDKALQSSGLVRSATRHGIDAVRNECAR